MRQLKHAPQNIADVLQPIHKDSSITDYIQEIISYTASIYKLAMYPKNSYLEKRSPSPTFVNITTTPFDYNLPSEQTTNNHHLHHHHHNYQHQQQNRHQQNHNKNFAHGSMKFAKTKAGLVNSGSTTTSTNIDKTELIYPEDAYSIEFCMPNDVTCKCPPTISSQTGISATTTYRDSTRRKSKNKPETSNRWTRKTSNNCSTDNHHHIEQHHSTTTLPDDNEILNLDNYCSPKQLQPPIYDVYSYAYLEPSPQQQQQQQQILDQTQLQQHHPLHKHHHHHQNKQASTSSTTSTTSSSSSTSFMPIYGGGGPSTSSGGSTSSSSKSPSRNSIKALLAKSFRNRANITNNSHHSSRSNSASAATSVTNSSNNIINTEKYTFTTRYGTTENLYEEVNDDKIRDILTTEQILNHQQQNQQPSTSQMSSTSPPQPPPINSKEEQRRVQNNHFRILDELNLSLEALIMPPTPPDISPTSGIIINNQENLLNGSKSVENISSALSSIDFKENIKERFYKTRNKIDCILKDNGGGSGGGGSSICSGSGLVSGGDIDSGLSVSDGSSCCNNDNNYKNRLDDNRRFATTMMMSSSSSIKNKHNNYKNNYNNCNNDNHSNNSGIAMTLISPSSPFKSMKRYFDSGGNTNQQKLSSPNDDCGGGVVDVKTKNNSNKFWTIRQ